MKRTADPLSGKEAAKDATSWDALVFKIRYLIQHQHVDVEDDSQAAFCISLFLYMTPETDPLVL